MRRGEREPERKREREKREKRDRCIRSWGGLGGLLKDVGRPLRNSDWFAPGMASV